MANGAEILLVEDNSSDADLTIRALKQKNLSDQIEWVKDGEEALDYLFARGKYGNRNINQKPSVILLDLKMPKINGLEVLKEIRENTVTKVIPVVILTSSNEVKDIIKSYELGANSYIVKPVEFNAFLQSVADVGHYWLSLNKSGSMEKG